MQKRKVYFRSDANSQIGYGHFIRSLALADMLKEDFDCTFFTQSPTEYQKQEVTKVCQLVALPATENRYNIFLDNLSGSEIVVLDNYFFTTAYQQQIKAKGCKLVCIDDMHDKHYVADIVINQGCNREEAFSVEPYTRLCLGLDWALLRRPFREVSKRTNTNSHTIETVVVCFGGSDLYDLTSQFAQFLLANSHTKHVIAVVGDAYKPHNGFICDSRLQYRSKLSANEMATFFLSTDMVVCSASTVCIEALACGAKVAAGWYVDNQQEFYDYIKEKHLHIALGNLLQSQTTQQFQALLDTAAVSTSSAPTLSINNLQARYVSLFSEL